MPVRVSLYVKKVESRKRVTNKTSMVDTVSFLFEEFWRKFFHEALNPDELSGVLFSI